MPRPFFIDTDTGSDDAVALLIALKHPGIDVVGIGVVADNVPLELGVQNALYTRELCGRLDVPVYAGEAAPLVELLAEGYAERIVPQDEAPLAARTARRHAVSWSNHLSAEATRIKLELERAARAGDPPTGRLRAEWRERTEDVVWALINSPEFVFVP